MTNSPHFATATRFLGRLFLLTAFVLAACSHNHQSLLNVGGAANYRHYPTGGGLFVSAAFDSDGKLWRVVPEKKHVYVDYSTDFGKTFSTPVVINPEAQRIKASGENRPNIVADSAGRIYVTYTAEGVQPAVVYYSVSSDKGQSFSLPVPLSDKASEANSFQGKLVLNAAGQTYAFWHDERNRTDWKQPGNAIYYSLINAQGKPASAEKIADTVCECCRIAAAFDSDVQPVLLLRFVYPGNIRDHGLVKPQAASRELSSWRVTFDQWHIEGCPDHGGALAISDEKYHIAWFTQGSERSGLFYASSTDNGLHFSKPLPFGNNEKRSGHPDVMAKGKRVVLIWTEFDGNKTQLLLMQSNDSGQTWLPAKAIAETTDEADFPFLLSNNNNAGLFVSWNSKNEGYRLIPVN